MAGRQHQPLDAFGGLGRHLCGTERGTSQLGASFLVIGAGCHIHSVMIPDCCFDLIGEFSEGSAGIEESQAILDVFCSMVGTGWLGICGRKAGKHRETIALSPQAVPQRGPACQVQRAKLPLHAEATGNRPCAFSSSSHQEISILSRSI
jgi:hypothetical protein